VNQWMWVCTIFRITKQVNNFLYFSAYLHHSFSVVLIKRSNICLLFCICRYVIVYILFCFVFRAAETKTLIWILRTFHRSQSFRHTSQQLTRYNCFNWHQSIFSYYNILKRFRSGLF
jgi:hypothetical protein